MNACVAGCVHVMTAPALAAFAAQRGHPAPHKVEAFSRPPTRMGPGSSIMGLSEPLRGHCTFGCRFKSGPIWVVVLKNSIYLINLCEVFPPATHVVSLVLKRTGEQIPQHSRQGHGLGYQYLVVRYR